MAHLLPSARRIHRMLRRITRENGDTLISFAATSALESGDPLAFLDDVTTYGCATGCVPSLIYLCDTHACFDRYYKDIEKIRQEYEDSTGTSVRIRYDLKNDLAWFAFEETALRLLDRLNAL